VRKGVLLKNYYLPAKFRYLTLKKKRNDLTPQFLNYGLFLTTRLFKSSYILSLNYWLLLGTSFFLNKNLLSAKPYVSEIKPLKS